MPRVNKKKFQIGVVGVGRMGANIARHLKDSGFPVTVLYDVRPSLATRLAKELEAKAVKKLAEVTATANTIITVVTDDKAMRSIFSLSGDSLLAGAEGRTFINCATITPC